MTRLVLDVLPSRTGVIAFYRRLGYAAGRNRSADHVSSIATCRTGWTPAPASAAARMSRLRSVPSLPAFGYAIQASRSRLDGRPGHGAEFGPAANERDDGVRRVRGGGRVRVALPCDRGHVAAPGEGRDSLARLDLQFGGDVHALSMPSACRAEK
jgi:hypothetical protein